MPGSLDPKRVARSLRSQNESKRQLHLGDRSVPKNVCTVKNEILGARKTTLTATGRQAACSELLPSFYVLLTQVLGTASSRQSQQQLQHCLRKNTNAAYRNIGPPRMSVIHFNSLYDRSKGLRTCWWCYVRSWCGVGGKQCIAMYESNLPNKHNGEDEAMAADICELQTLRNAARNHSCEEFQNKLPQPTWRQEISRLRPLRR